MYEVIKNVIGSGSFALQHILTKIDTLWLQGSLTEEERLALIGLAREKADPANSFAPLQAQIDALAARVAALEGAGEGQEEFPAYIQPTGGHDAYHAGDQVTYGGKHYLCIAPEGVAVVWDPDVYPSYWQEVTGLDS